MGVFDLLASSPANDPVPEPKRGGSLFDQTALENTPPSEYAHAGRKAGRVALQYGPPDGPEFRRISRLPSRDWRTAYDVPALITQYTEEFGPDDGRLLPMQAVGLHELRTFDRLYVVAGLGTGKTLLSGLAPRALGASADEVAFIPPARLVRKTIDELAEYARKGWKVTEPRHIISAEQFSDSNSATWLLDRAPRVIVLDEAHCFGPLEGSGRSSRLQQYLEHAKHRVYVIPMTGTPGDSTLRTIRHLLAWALGPEACPLPMDTSEFWIWSQALDYDPGYDSTTKRARKRPPVGVLAAFSETREIDGVREGVGRRIESTPGVFYYRQDDVSAQLRISDIVYDGHSSVLVREFAAARDGGDELADGRVLDVPVLDSVLFATLGLGFARVIDPPPPDDWREARRAYNSLAREILSDPDSGLHTPDQIKQRFRSGHLRHPAYDRWSELEPTFKMCRHTVWIDCGALEFVAGLCSGRRLVWTAFPEFGRRLSSLTGLPFFHSQGLTSDGMSIDTYQPGKDGPDTVILSIRANAEGRNLQDRWSDNLIVGVPGKADLLQQLIGRTHRRGQIAETVEARILMASIENPVALYRARDRAQFDRTLGKALQSRLLDCGWDVPALAVYRKLGSAAWLQRAA